eukprot:3569898-Rhodomonas_salina.2
MSDAVADTVADTEVNTAILTDTVTDILAHSHNLRTRQHHTLYAIRFTPYSIRYTPYSPVSPLSLSSLSPPFASSSSLCRFAQPELGTCVVARDQFVVW